ncbi:hypothetical protein QTQ03_19400 [Micromonospora sp. WMMA1363]|uniref:hypothetical protein n=1 Tax=Micromonospora sp. WMMA1363 TaxID=3053985 RepID=UPI00259CE605|nr:hypothetical protein [Micromonospora sp. WMMA1363]MDM4721650.1 hypothetical protein [Micromonospora sp. WMMA1363]
MAMVNQPAARRHWSRIAYTFGILALVGAATTLVVVVRDPALSSSRLTTPVPAPEITVVEDPAFWHEGDLEPFAADEVLDEPAEVPPADRPAGRPGHPQAASHPSDDVRRSLFWSGIFGLAISLAGLGLVGTRRRMW